MLDNPKIDIRTARLHLRGVRAGDADRLFPLFANWKVIRWLSSPPWPYRREDMQRYARQDQDAGDHETRFVITRDAVPIGLIGVRMRPASHVQRLPGLNVGYWIGEPYWGHGYMSEAAHAVAAQLFSDNANAALYAGAFVGNTASLRVQEKLGFVRDGEAMLFSNPLQKELPHINTVLTREAFGGATG